MVGSDEIKAIMFAADQYIDETVLKDVAAFLELEWSTLTVEEREQLRCFSILQKRILASAGHAKKNRKLESDLRPAEEVWSVLSVIRESDCEIVDYRIHLQSGSHSLRPLGGEESITVGTIYVIDSGLKCVEDAEYCCEQCDGKRTPTNLERQVGGFYGGWTSLAENPSMVARQAQTQHPFDRRSDGFYPGVFIAMSRASETLSERAAHHSDWAPGNTAEDRFRSFLYPWGYS